MDAITEKEIAAGITEPRARIGLIIPSVNRMTEPQFNHYAPDGLGVQHAGRIDIRCDRRHAAAARERASDETRGEKRRS